MRLFIFSLCYSGVAAKPHISRGLSFKTPSFLEDSVTLNKATAVRLFRGKLVTLLNSLSARRHCRFVSNLSHKLGLGLSRTQDLINKLTNASTSVRDKKHKKRACRHFHTKVTQLKKLFRIKDAKSPTKKSERLKIIKKELPSLYNNLPLPFQCEILFEIGRLSAYKSFEILENSVESVTKMNLYEVGNIIKKSEKAVNSEVSIVRVGDRCVKVLAGKKYRTTDIIISVDIGNQELKKWESSFRAKIQWIMGKFAVDNGIKIDNLHNLTAKHNLPYSAYFAHILNASQIGQRFEIKFHMHLLQTNSRALEARFVLAALNALSTKDLKKILDVSYVKYWAVDHDIGTAIESVHSYNLKMLFPTYLRRFFNKALRRHERCLIIHLMSHYSNSSNEKVTEFLRRKRVDVKFPCSIVNGVMSVVLSPKRNRENEVVVRKTELSTGMTTPRTLELHPFWNLGNEGRSPPVTESVKGVQKKVITYRKATMVEIIMFILLGSLAVVLVIFFVTCVLFIVRKRAVRKEQSLTSLQQQQPVNLDPQITTQHSPLNSNGYHMGSDCSQRGDNLLTVANVRLNNTQTTGGRLMNLTLEPLRFSTDDEESRCDDDANSCISSAARYPGGVASFYRGGRRLVPAVRYSKSLARKLAQSDSERTILEKVPERSASSHEEEAVHDGNSAPKKRQRSKTRRSKSQELKHGNGAVVLHGQKHACNGKYHKIHSRSHNTEEEARKEQCCDRIPIKAQLHYGQAEDDVVKNENVFPIRPRSKSYEESARDLPVTKQRSSSLQERLPADAMDVANGDSVAKPTQQQQQKLQHQVETLHGEHYSGDKPAPPEIVCIRDDSWNAPFSSSDSLSKRKSNEEIQTHEDSNFAGNNHKVEKHSVGQDINIKSNSKLFTTL